MMIHPFIFHSKRILYLRVINNRGGEKNKKSVTTFFENFENGYGAVKAFSTIALTTAIL